MGAGLNKMLEGLHRAFRGQERFISDVSHELKTPLAALLTEAQVLHAMGATTEDYKAFVASAEDEARRLGKLVESFLMLARFQHGKRFIADTLVSINDVVLESMKHSQMIAEQQRVGLLLTAFDAGEECNEGEVRGDPDLLRVAFDNVIRNAVQFSKAGSAVRIEVTCVEGRMMVSIRDQGPGIPPEHRDRIFNRFEQAPTRESGKRGTGLGLAIAKGVIDLHGGTISVDNHPEGGCVFRIGLAMPGPAAAGPGNPGPSGVRTVPGRAG
jgi:signal transduction histidine kinase